MKFSESSRNALRPGFSVIELLVAMAITSVIMIALFSLVGTTTDSYTRTQRAVNTVSQARAFVRFFENELSTRLPSTYFIRDSADSSGGPETSDKIAFVRTLSEDEQDVLAETTPPDPGDLGTAVYYVGYLDAPGDALVPALFRKQLGPRETQEAVITPGTSASFPTTDPANDEPIVLNLLGFHARPQFVNSAGALEDWSGTSSAAPSVLELTIRFIDDSSARRFKTKADWDRLATAPRDQEKPLIREFTRTLTLAQ